MMIKECRRFVRMVNFVSIFCPELQGLLKPIYDLMQKDRHFIWGEEQQKAFNEIKSRLQRPQCCICQIGKGDFSGTQIQASFQQIVLCIKSRMANLNSLPMPAKECQKLPRTILTQS